MNEGEISPNGKPPDKPVQQPANSPRRILVVEDDDNIRTLNTEVLIYFGYHVDAAEDGAVAWDTLQSNSYHLVVTDNDMPKVTGMELLQKLHAARMALPVVMATGALPKDSFIHCPWLLPAALLLKPYTTDELVTTVQGVLRATEGARDQIAPQNQQSKSPADAWKL